jgi:hypothetical protein
MTRSASFIRGAKGVPGVAGTTLRCRMAHRNGTWPDIPNGYNLSGIGHNMGLPLYLPLCGKVEVRESESFNLEQMQNLYQASGILFGKLWSSF